MVLITEVEDEPQLPARAAPPPARPAAVAAARGEPDDMVTVMLGPGGRLLGGGGAAAPARRDEARVAAPARAPAPAAAAPRAPVATAEGTGSRPAPVPPPPASGVYATALALYAAGDFSAAAAAVEAAGAGAGTEAQLLLRRARLAAASATAAADAAAAADADAAKHGTPAADARGRVDSPSQLLTVRALVAALSTPNNEDDDDGAADVAPAPGGATMQLLALAQALSRGGASAQALFRALEGHAAVAAHLRAPTLAAAAAALRAGGTLPAGAAALLAAAATHPRADPAAASAALTLLAAAAASSLEARIVALAPPPGAAAAPLAPLLAMVHTPARLARLPVQAAEQVATLLGAFAADGASRAALSLVKERDCAPLSALLTLYSAADALPGGGGSAGAFDPVATREALAQARSVDESRAAVAAAARRVLSPAAVAARRAALTAFAALAAEPALLRAEAYRRNKAGALERTPLLGRLVAALRDVAGRCPRRTAATLGWDGRPKGYSPKRYAADYDDNAAGDALLPAALAAASGGPPAPDDVAAAAAPPPGSSLLELALRCVRASLCASPGNAAKALHAAGVLEALEPLYDFATPAVARAAEAAAGAIAAGCAAAAEELLNAQLPAPLAGALGAGDAALAAAAADKLSALVPTASGDEFAALQAPGGGLQALHTAICHAEAAHEVPHARIVAAFLACAERARSCAGQGGRRTPAGGYWDIMGTAELQRLEAKLGSPATSSEAAPKLAAKPAAAAPKAVVSASTTAVVAKPAPPPAAKPPPPPAREKPLPWDPTGAAAAAKAAAAAAAAKAAAAAPPPLLKKGFFAPRATANAPPADAAVRRAAVEAAAKAAKAARAAAEAAAWAAPTSWSSAVEEEDEALILEAPAPSTPPNADGPSSTAASKSNTEAEFDEDGLRVAFDSAGLGAAGAARRAARAAWASTELRARLRWSQTSAEVHVTLGMPRGTRARELTVAVTPTRLTVTLAWHGRVVDGPLSRRCKAREAAWALEGDELSIMIPKDDPYFWKSLFEGGEEKSHVTVLQELINADEAAPAYDELDDEAKDLLEDMREQQQMMAEGLIDPINGLDDFRLVIGDGDGGK